MRSHFVALQFALRESTSQELSIYTTNWVESSNSSISLVMKRNVSFAAKQGTQAQVRITAPVNNNKHHPKCYPLTARLWSYKITCSGSGVLRLHPIHLTTATDFSSKQQEQLNCCMPQAADRRDCGSIHQLWKQQGLSDRQSIALTAEHGSISPSSVLSTTKFLPTGLTKKSFHTSDLEIILTWTIQARHLRKHKILWVSHTHP